MTVVLDTCVLKLATFPRTDNAAALIVELVLRRLIEAWASPAMLDEYIEVLGENPELLAELTRHIQLCFPITLLAVIRHAPDNRFVEAAFAVKADYLVTVNTARGHFDRARYGATRVCTPGMFINLPETQTLIRKIIHP